MAHPLCRVMLCVASSLSHAMWSFCGNVLLAHVSCYPPRITHGMSPGATIPHTIPSRDKTTHHTTIPRWCEIRQDQTSHHTFPHIAPLRSGCDEMQCGLSSHAMPIASCMAEDKNETSHCPTYGKRRDWTRRESHTDTPHT